MLFSTEIKPLVEDCTGGIFPWWKVGWENFWLVQVNPPHPPSRENPVRACWSWDRGLRHLLHICVVLETKFIQGQYSFFDDKKEKLLKALLTCTFITWFLNSLDLCSYSSESKKLIYTARANDLPGERVCLGGLGVRWKLCTSHCWEFRFTLIRLI